MSAVIYAHAGVRSPVPQGTHPTRHRRSSRVSARGLPVEVGVVARGGSGWEGSPLGARPRAECAWPVLGLTGHMRPTGLEGTGSTRRDAPEGRARRIEPAERVSRRAPRGFTCPP